MNASTDPIQEAQPDLGFDLEAAARSSNLGVTGADVLMCLAIDPGEIQSTACLVLSPAPRQYTALSTCTLANAELVARLSTLARLRSKLLAALAIESMRPYGVVSAGGDGARCVFRLTSEINKLIGCLWLIAQQAGVPCYQLSRPEVCLQLTGNPTAKKGAVNKLLAQMVDGPMPKGEHAKDGLALAATLIDRLRIQRRLIQKYGPEAAKKGLQAGFPALFCPPKGTQRRRDQMALCLNERAGKCADRHTSINPVEGIS